MLFAKKKSKKPASATPQQAERPRRKPARSVTLFAQALPGEQKARLRYCGSKPARPPPPARPQAGPPARVPDGGKRGSAPPALLLRIAKSWPGGIPPGHIKSFLRAADSRKRGGGAAPFMALKSRSATLLCASLPLYASAPTLQRILQYSTSLRATLAAIYLLCHAACKRKSKQRARANEDLGPPQRVQGARCCLLTCLPCFCALHALLRHWR